MQSTVCSMFRNPLQDGAEICSLPQYTRNLIVAEALQIQEAK
jgi:hypothetical protein